MSVDLNVSLHPLQRVLGAVDDALGGADDAALWSLGDREVDALLVGLERAIGRLRARSLAVLTEARGRNRAGVAGATSHPVWVAGLLGVTPAEAVRLSAAAHALDVARRDAASAPIVDDALGGDIGVAHAVAAAEAVEALPADLDPPVRTRAVALMREHARLFDSAQLARVGQRLVAVVDPDRGDALLAVALEREERRAAQSRSLTMCAVQAGLVRGRFVLPAVDAEAVATALRPLAAPRPAAPTRTATDGDPWTDADGSAAGMAARDPRTFPQRMADALVELATAALAAGDLPLNGGERPQLVVTVGIDQLRSRTGVAETLDGSPVSPAQLRRIACDSSVLPAVLGGAGQPLDIGRETRVVPTGIRRALVLRDRGCAFPGCDRPAPWCDAHHITHWADGGSTALGNLVLLCGFHHRTVHGTPWTVSIDEPGRPVWRPPPWLAPPGTVLPSRPPWLDGRGTDP